MPLATATWWQIFGPLAPEMLISGHESPLRVALVCASRVAFADGENTEIAISRAIVESATSYTALDEAARRTILSGSAWTTHEPLFTPISKWPGLTSLLHVHPSMQGRLSSLHGIQRSASLSFPSRCSGRIAPLEGTTTAARCVTQHRPDGGWALGHTHRGASPVRVYDRPTGQCWRSRVARLWNQLPGSYSRRRLGDGESLHQC